MILTNLIVALFSDAYEENIGVVFVILGTGVLPIINVLISIFFSIKLISPSKLEYYENLNQKLDYYEKIYNEKLGNFKTSKIFFFSGIIFCVIYVIAVGMIMIS